MIDGIKIFDAHMHIIGRFKKREQSLADYLDQYGIDKAVITSLNTKASLNSIAALSNFNGELNSSAKEQFDKFRMKEQYEHKEVLNIIRENPDRFVGFFWFNPKIAKRNDEHYTLLEKYLKEYDFKGVKTQWNVDNLTIKDFEELAEFLIEKDVPLFFHTGYPFAFQRPIRAKDIRKFVKKYPALKVIVGHAAFTMEHCIDVLMFLKDCSNVYFETSISVPYGIGTLIKAMGNHRVIFGSDSPSATTPDIEINKIRILNLDKETLEKVFYNNISEVIGVE